MESKRIRRITKQLFPVFSENFEKGYRKDPGGIVKTINIVTGAILNPVFPWWSLVEAMRAAIVLAGTSLEIERNYCLEVYRRCRGNYLEQYVCPAGGMAGVQALDEDGSVSDIIPAVPDVDPGYHTGLCFLDVMHYIHKMGKNDFGI